MADRTRDILRLHSMLARLMADDRFTDGRRQGHELRAFLIAYFWAGFELHTHDGRFTRALDLAGMRLRRDDGLDHASYRWRQLVTADTPRYEPPDLNFRYALCPVRMLRGPRAGQPCGKSSSVSFRVTDPLTGIWRIEGWCTAHKAHSDPVWLAQRAMKGTPVPLPNVGGLLPSYIRATNWPDVYASQTPGWKPPAVGIIADQWPVMEKVVSYAKPTLAIVPRGTDGPDRLSVLINGEVVRETPVPALRLVTDDE